MMGGITIMPNNTSKREQFVSVAMSQVGTKEKRLGGRWVNKSKYNYWYASKVHNRAFVDGAWCHMFVSWVAAQAGMLGEVPLTAWCPSGLSRFQQKGQARRGKNPRRGDVVYFIRNGGTRHVGIVVKRVGSRILTVEGNTNNNGSYSGNGVYYRYRRIGPDQWYCTPDWGHVRHVPSGSWSGSRFPGRDVFKLGNRHPAITLLGQRLVAHGYGGHYKVGPGPSFGPADRAAVMAFQKAQGWSGGDADGYPGPETWRRLMASPTATKPPKAKRPVARTVVSLAAVRSSFVRDAKAKQGATTNWAMVKLVEEALASEGLLARKWVDGSAGTMTHRAYKVWQRKLGYRGRDADGIPGKTSLEKLGQRHGFSVSP